ncbi:MAG TPA: SMP-30/gluconolactonase/LRE family protein [Devosiaceae bacterium]|jgi:gluconolactonase
MFDGQTPEFRVITSSLRFPEGPIAMPDGSVILVELNGQCLSRVSPDGAITKIADIPGAPNGAAIGPDGKCYVCNNGGVRWHRDENGLRGVGQSSDYVTGSIERVDLATGQVERLYEGTAAGNLRSPNDIVFDREGGFWFTDRGKTRPRDMDFGGVYYAKADGSFIAEVIHPFVSPNGIGLSADENTLYVAETMGGRIWAFDITAPGQVRKDPWPTPNGGRYLGSSTGYRPFDSLALDSKGNICAATLADPGITIISADGRTTSFFPLPDKMTTNICFGGPDLRTAFITLSATGRLIAMDWPYPGLPLNFLNK